MSKKSYVSTLFVKKGRFRRHTVSGDWISDAIYSTTKSGEHWPERNLIAPLPDIRSSPSTEYKKGGYGGERYKESMWLQDRVQKD